MPSLVHPSNLLVPGFTPPEDLSTATETAHAMNSDPMSPGEVEQASNLKSSLAAANPPSSFMCPVCWELMGDPVILDTGHSYDRGCIERWVFQQGFRTCPVTGQRLNHIELIPNHALR